MQQESRQNMAAPNQSQGSKQTHQVKQVATLTSKINTQAERILKLKLNTEMELKKRDEQAKEFECTIQRQHNNLLNQQLQCEKISQRLQSELLNRGELKRKIENTREICTILQNYCSQLTGTLQRCIDEKEMLKSVYDDQMKEIDDLSQKFNGLSEQHNTNVEQLKAMVEEERQGRDKNYNDAKALKAAMEQRLETLSKVLQSEKERTETLESQLVKSELVIQHLSKEKEAYCRQLESVKNKLQEVENTLTLEREQLKQELGLMHQSLTEEKAKMNTLKADGDEVLAKFYDALKGQEEAIADGNKKQLLIDELTTDRDTKAQEISENKALIADLNKEKHFLEDQVQDLEQLRAEFSHLQISLEKTALEKERETEQLCIALDELKQFHLVIQQNEKLIKKCEEERIISDQQILCLEKANNELDAKLAQAQSLISTMITDIAQLKEDLEAKCVEVETVRSSLKSLSDASETEIKEKQKDADDLKITNTELKNKVQELTFSVTQLENKSSKLEQEIRDSQVALAQEQVRGSTCASSLEDSSAQLTDLKTQLATTQKEISQTKTLLTRSELDKQQLEARLENLLQEMVKLSGEKNNALSEAACAARDKQIIEAQLDTKLKDAVSFFEKYKQDTEELMQQNDVKNQSLIDEVKHLKENNQTIQNKLSLTEKQLEDTLGKIKTIAEKNESKKQRLLEKVTQLEKRLRVKDSEMRALKGQVNTLSPKAPSVAGSTDSSRPAHQTPVTGIPVTPKMKSAEPASRSILKTPPTTPMTRKKVMFQEESSDTDVSAVDILVLDEREVQRRLEAIKRGDKINNTPLSVIKSPKLPGIMKREQNKPPKELPALKRSCYGGDEQPKPKRLFNKENPAKNKSYQNVFENAFGFDD